jgi:hypothetical protein
MDLLTYARAFNVPAADADTAAKAYSLTLASLPADLLVLAVQRTKAGHKWGMRLPLPVEITAQVSGELAERNRLLAKLTIARQAPVESERPRATQSEKDRVTEIMAAWRTERSQQEARERETERKSEPIKPIYVQNPLLDAYVAKAREEGAA